MLEEFLEPFKCCIIYCYKLMLSESSTKSCISNSPFNSWACLLSKMKAWPEYKFIQYCKTGVITYILQLTMCKKVQNFTEFRKNMSQNMYLKAFKSLQFNDLNYILFWIQFFFLKLAKFWAFSNTVNFSVRCLETKRGILLVKISQIVWSYLHHFEKVPCEYSTTWRLNRF